MLACQVVLQEVVAGRGAINTRFFFAIFFFRPFAGLAMARPKGQEMTAHKAKIAKNDAQKAKADMERNGRPKG